LFAVYEDKAFHNPSVRKFLPALRAKPFALYTA
jgi:hypothetical protein